MNCKLFIREIIASTFEIGFKCLAVDICYSWAGVKPMCRNGLKCYGSPEFINSIFSAIAWIEANDWLSACRIHDSLKYIAEGLAEDDFVFLRSRGVLLGKKTDKHDNRIIVRQLIKAAVSCRVYSGFRIWTSRMDGDQVRRVRRLSVYAVRRLFVEKMALEVGG